MPDPRLDPLIQSLRPYNEHDLPTYEHIHATVTPRTVPTALLHPTQPTLNLHRLLAIHHGQPCEGPDPYPHIVNHHGQLFIHNGHHRWTNALLRGDPTITVRITETHGKDVSMTRRLIIIVEPLSFLDDKDPMEVAENMLTAAGEYSIDGRLIDARWEDPSNE